MDITRTLVLIKGAGDLASGVAARLHRCGFPVVMTELPAPLMVRRTVSFGEAVYEGECTVEEIVARRVSGPDAARATLAAGVIPVLVDPDALPTGAMALEPGVVIDAILAKRNTGTSLGGPGRPLVIGLGPGFVAGIDCHATVETQRGHWLGRVYWKGSTLPDTGIPGEIAGESARRVLRAPADGVFLAQTSIGDQVRTGQVLASIAGSAVHAGCEGILRGLLRSGLAVTAGLKLGDVDPRAQREHCFTISDKSLAVGGGVLEAILCFFR